jgi:hypothetical protein
MAASTLFGLWAFPITAPSLSPEDAACGRNRYRLWSVVSANMRPTCSRNRCYWTLGKPLSLCFFTAVIYGDHRAKFETPHARPPAAAGDTKVVIQFAQA